MLIARAQRRIAGLLVACCALATAPVHAQAVGHERRLDDPIAELVPRPLSDPSVAMAAERFLLVWTDSRLSSDARPINQVMAARVTPEGEVLDPRGIAVATTGAQRREPRVTANGDGFIVMWRESRSWGSEDTHFARIDRDGHVLDPEGRALPFDVGEPSCWEGQCLGAPAAQLAISVRGFDECGTPRTESTLTVPPLASSQSFATATAPRIISGCDGHALAVGEHDEKSGESWIQLAGYDLDGTMRYSRKLQSVTDTRSILPVFDFAANDSGELLFVFRQGEDEVWTLRTDRDGTPLAPAKELSRGQGLALAFDGDGYVVVGESGELDSLRLDAEGEPRDEVPARIVGVDSPGLRDHLQIAAGPRGSLVVWRPESTDIFGELNAARLGPDGRLLDPDGLAVAASANQQWGAQLAREDDGYALTFHDDRPDAPGLRTVHLDAHGAPEPATTQLIDRDPAAALQASDGTRTLVQGDGAVLAIDYGRGRLCGEDQACDTTLTLTLLDPQGQPDPGRPGVTFGPDGEWGRSDAVAAYDGDGFVVAYRQARVEARPNDAGTRVVHVALDGSTSPAEPTIIAQSPETVLERPLAIAAADDGYLLLLARTSALVSAQVISLVAVRLDRTLEPIDGSALEIASGEIERVHPSIADDGAAWLLVWQERAEHGSWDIRGARVPHSAGQVNAFNVAVSALDELAPTIAAIGPGRALVAYERFDDAPSAMIGRVFLREIAGDDACDAECCGECPEASPTAEACVPSEHASACAGEDGERARYGCGCGVAGAASRALGGWAMLVMGVSAALLGRRRRDRLGAAGRERGRAVNARRR